MIHIPKPRALALMFLVLAALTMSACGSEDHSGHDHGKDGHKDDHSNEKR